MLNAFLPILAATFYGLSFAFTEKAFKIINVSTYLFWGGVLAFTSCALLLKIKNESLIFDMGGSWSNFWIVAVAVTAPSIGWILTIFAIKNTSASYAAFAEISYPLFTLLFLFVFFGLRSIDWSVIAGGALIMIGSFIMISGQLSKG